MNKAWWENRPLRIYHPNAREYENRNLDIERFVNDCAATHAEAIVVSAGGIFAFYRSRVPFHFISPAIGNIDLLKEITLLAHNKKLKVLARVDFSRAREDVFSVHPEWFLRKSNGESHRVNEYYLTCPSGGYQNEDFAFKVLQEVFIDYNVDGIHVNAGGFVEFCYCESCRSGFGDPIPKNPDDDPDAWIRFLRWRQEVIGKLFSDYYDTIRKVNPKAFLMAELPGQEYSEWERRHAFHLPSLRNSFSQVLLTTGGISSPRQSRWWTGMTVDKVHAINNTPITNIKMQMRDRGYTHAILPTNEFLFFGYQAIAHGAGLKLATFGIPQYLPDKRTMDDISGILGYMKKHQEILDTMLPMNNTALVYPEYALLKGPAMEGTATEGLRGEFAGLYNALKARHFRFGVLIDEEITIERLKEYKTIIILTAVWLSDDQVEAVTEFVREGGKVILLDSASTQAGSFYPMPKSISELLHCDFSEKSGKSDYMMSTTQQFSGEFPYVNIIPLTEPFRIIKSNNRADILFTSSSSNEADSPEDFHEINAGEYPVIIKADIGKGYLIYMATAFGRMILNLGHTDYYDLLEILAGDDLQSQELVTDAPSTVEVNLASWEKGLVVNLVNSSGIVPLDKPVRVGPIHFDIGCEKVSKIVVYRPGEEIEALIFSHEYGRIKTEILYMDIFAQVVIYT